MSGTTSPLVLVRIHTSRLRSKVLGLSAEQLILGHCRSGLRHSQMIRAATTTEDLLRLLRRHTAVPLTNIRRIRVTPPLELLFFGRNWKVDFVTAHRRHSFVLDEDAQTLVLAQLEAACPGRLSRRSALWSLLPRALSLLLLLAGGFGLAFLLSSFRAKEDEIWVDPLLRLAAMAIVAGVVLTIAWAVLLGTLPARRLIRWAWRVRPRDTPAPQRDLSLSRPYRLRALGWVLKAAAAVCFPIALLVETHFVMHLGPVILEWLTSSNSPNWLDVLYAFSLASTAGSLLFFAPLVFLLYWSYRLTVPPFRWEDARAGAPVLFLRAFADDRGHHLHPDSRLARLSGIGNPWGSSSPGLRRSRLDFLANFFPTRLFRLLFNRPCDTAEEALARYLRRFGPTIAIGRPGETVRSAGFQRFYVANTDWQKEIRAVLTISRIVVIQPGVTEGILWEVREAFRVVESRRILLSMVSFHGKPDDYDRFRVQFEVATGRQLPVTALPDDRIAFVYFDPDGQARFQPLSHVSPLLWPYFGKIADLHYSLAAFLASACEGRSLEPRPVREQRVATALAWIALPLSWLLLGGLPTAAVLMAYHALMDGPGAF